MSKKKRAKQAKRAAAAGWNAPPAGQPVAGLMGGLQGLLGTRRSEQFLVGALLGAAAVYVLGDEKLRAKLIKAGIGLYTGIAGGFEEMKEQIADIQAEMQAEGGSAP